jgi:hypothetical protein
VYSSQKIALFKAENTSAALRLLSSEEKQTFFVNFKQLSEEDMVKQANLIV